MNCNNRYMTNKKKNNFTKSEIIMKLNIVRIQLECCGNEGPEDWKSYAIYAFSDEMMELHNRTYPMPNSCCYPGQSCLYHYQDGCHNKLTFIVTIIAAVLSIGSICLAFLHVSN